MDAQTVAATMSADWLDPAGVGARLAAPAPDAARIEDILAKARELAGLTGAEVAALCHVSAPEQLAALFAAARQVKETIYGRRMVLFAPLYISNVCGNDCAYCAFSSSNKALARTALEPEAIARETRALLRQGHKRVLLVAGEGYAAARGGFRYVLDAIEAVYGANAGGANGATIRRVNANLAPLTIDEFAQLKAAQIGTYQLFQETYHRPTYAAVHRAGRKRDFDWRATAFDRAMQAGIDDVGMGVLFGLADWRFELLSLLQHVEHLEARFGVGCHTISVPRLEPADGAPLSLAPPAPVSDADFMKLIAILRLAVPYTGIILSTRESAAIRRDCYALGVSQISAGSCTHPGGYTAGAGDAEGAASGQFQLGDHRPLAEVVDELAGMGFIPSFCTACYRLGRTGQDFMDLAKPGLIKQKCDPNALSTFAEYLIDYTGPALRSNGEAAIARQLETMDDKVRRNAQRMLAHIHAGRRDVCC